MGSSPHVHESNECAGMQARDVIHASHHAALQRALTLCTHAHRRACVTRFVLACSSTCMRAQGPWSFAPCRSTRTRETCAFAERCDGFRPQRPGSHHGRAGFQNNVQVSMSDLHVSMSRFCPGVRQAARNPSINPCFWMERSVGTLNWFTTMLGWQVNQTGRVAIKNIEVERKKSKRRQGSHFARRLVSRGLGFLDRWCS